MNGKTETGISNAELNNGLQHMADDHPCCKDTIRMTIDQLEQLKRENAALRADKERLVAMVERWFKVATDCHQEIREVGSSEYNITVGLMCDTRALLDAARKEAQP